MAGYRGAWTPLLGPLARLSCADRVRLLAFACELRRLPRGASKDSPSDYSLKRQRSVALPDAATVSVQSVVVTKASGRAMPHSTPGKMGLFSLS